MQPASLKYFMEVVRCRSFRRAAERLRIAPSAISRQITKLEYDLGAAVFERHANGVVLTEAGQVLADYASKATTDIEALRREIDDLSALRRGHVELATVEAMTADFLPNCLAAFQKKYPGITVSVIVLGADAVADAVLKDEVDIGIAYSVSQCRELTVRARLPQPLHVILSPDHPLASCKHLSFDQLKGARVALPIHSFGIRALVDRVAKATRCSLIQVLETNTLDMLKGLVRKSDTITFMPESAVINELALGTLAAVPLTDPVLAATFIDVLTGTNRKLSRAASALLTDVEELVGRVIPPRGRTKRVDAASGLARRGRVAVRATTTAQN